MIPLVLVIGGMGSFGRRLVEGLLATTEAAVVIGGRAPQRHTSDVQALQQRYGADRVGAIAIDRDAALDILRVLKPFCVVDAAGPFQNAEPSLARAAIAAGCHYVDLADARDFVARFGALDTLARDAGILAVTGASSTPALSGAVVADLTAGWQDISEITVAISPGNRAPRGLSVVEAILAYAGQPIRVLFHGGWTKLPGWGALTRQDMPGLGRRWLSLCETPDLDLLPARYPSADTVLFRAGLELPILHLGLWLLTLPVRGGLVSSLRPYAHLLHKIASRFEPLGTDRGGMCVEASGRDHEGRAAKAVWSLVAEAGDGPNIPVLPALALIRGLLQGTITARGAGHAGELLTLGAIVREFSRFKIRGRRAVSWPEAANLFEKALGPNIAHLPPLVRHVHNGQPLRLKGRAAIDGAQHWAGKLIARLFGFPGTTPDTEADILLERQGDRETWIRRFGGKTFRSTLRPTSAPRRVFERFGPFRFELELTPHRGGFELTIVGWSLGPLRLPKGLAPRSPARAFVDDKGRYRFDVAIILPWVGQIVRYRGWAMPDL
jgi:saccharopine dehydrogenase-like NADP-dependent oxidoreductase